MHCLADGGIVANLRLHVDDRRSLRDLRGGDKRAAPGHVQGICDDKIHVAVDPSAENVLACPRRQHGIP